LIIQQQYSRQQAIMKGPAEYDMEDVSNWLKAIDQPSTVVDAFRTNAIDGDMLVSLTMEDLRDEDLGLSKLQATKLMQQLEFTKELAAACNNSTTGGGGGGGEEDAEKIRVLEEKCANIKSENVALKAQIEEYQTAPAPAQSPKAAAPPPQPQKHQKNEHEVVKGAARGAARGAVGGAIVGAITGDPAQGAAAGAAAGAALGGMDGLAARRRRRMLR
jgi:SAM domain (Sterile alpha motif)/Glycine-zipper domain